MKREYKLLIFLLFCVIQASAQKKGEVIVIKDPSIDSLIAKRISVLKNVKTPVVPAQKPGTTIVSQYGFRVQIYNGSDRREAFAAQARFKEMHRKHNAYITYKAPNYYLRVGDFRTRLEAQRFLNELKPNFPIVFIFREKINAPNVD